MQTLLLFAVAAAAASQPIPPPTGLEHEVKPQFGDLDSMLGLAAKGIKDLIVAQKRALATLA